MNTFSERYGYKSIRDVMQFESMDSDLRNGIWNLLTQDPFEINARFNHNCVIIWKDFFKFTIDTMPKNPHDNLRRLRKYFFEYKWNEVYDFIEFIAHYCYEYQQWSNEFISNKFISYCNALFEKEMSAYRFVDGKITPITNQQEITAIEQATKENKGPVATHLDTALGYMSNRTKPDYRNSVKESISAIESLVKQICDVEKGTLGDLLKKLPDKIKLPLSLAKAFSNLYGYTSNAAGIRHALLHGKEGEEMKVDFNDAKYMLVTCSAFINYVNGKMEIKN